MKEKIYQHIKQNKKPHHPKELSRVLGFSRPEVKAALAELVAEGRLVKARGHYRLPEEKEGFRGRISLARDGYGFVIPADGGPDLFVPKERLKGAWHGDVVRARVRGRGRDGRASGEVVEILERARRRAVGRVFFRRGYAWLAPEDGRTPEIKLLPEGLENVPEGSRVAVEIVYPEESGKKAPFGRVLEVLAEGDEVEAELRAVILKHDLREAFPEEVLAEAARVAHPPTAADLEGRADFRGLNVFTIDGADAKDFDDALHLTRLENGDLEVGVHIADVSHYVPQGSALDEEAYLRGTSVYLPGRVLPMLPEAISNGVASLVPGVDRLTLSMIARLSPEGEVKDVRFEKGVIRSKARLTYDQVERFLEGGRLPEAADFFAEDLRALDALAQKLKAKRLEAGAIEFDFPEVKVDLTEDGGVLLIPQKEVRARSLIEEMMLLANRLVARTLSERGLPALYRVHEDPAEDRYAELVAALSRLGYEIEAKEPSPKAFQDVLKAASGRPEAPAVATLLLRSLKLARYAEENLGHFGLAFRDYLHFTSPIRRYPDLVVHRVLKALIEGRLDERQKEVWAARFPAIAEHASVQERKAEAAERDLAKYHQARWALMHRGERFRGVVSGVQSFGAFVALENGVEGLVRAADLGPDTYAYVPELLALVGANTGHKVRLGDPMEVVITGANPLLRQIDLAPVEEVRMSEKKQQKKRTRRRVVGPPQGKDRPERPVKLTVHKMYFGEWEDKQKKKKG